MDAIPRVSLLLSETILRRPKHHETHNEGTEINVVFILLPPAIHVLGFNIAQSLSLLPDEVCAKHGLQQLCRVTGIAPDQRELLGIGTSNRPGSAVRTWALNTLNPVSHLSETIQTLKVRYKGRNTYQA